MNSSQANAKTRSPHASHATHAKPLMRTMSGMSALRMARPIWVGSGAAVGSGQPTGRMRAQGSAATPATVRRPRRGLDPPCRGLAQPPVETVPSPSAAVLSPIAAVAVRELHAGRVAARKQLSP